MKYVIGGVAAADTLEDALRQREIVFRVAGRRNVPIVLKETGEVVTKRMAVKLRAEESKQDGENERTAREVEGGDAGPSA